MHPDNDHASMDREQCFAVLSLLMDDRPVDADLASRARTFAETDPECRAALEDWRRIHDVLSTEPPMQPRPGFTERVVAASRRPVGEVLPFVQRLAAAAAVALALTVGWGVARPQLAVGDDSVERTAHYVDVFRTTPYAADDLSRGLDTLLRSSDPLGRGTR
jgi:hypothetical protein